MQGGDSSIIKRGYANDPGSRTTRTAIARTSGESGNHCTLKGQRQVLKKRNWDFALILRGMDIATIPLHRFFIAKESSCLTKY